jgi:hypothetical protein
MFFKKKSSLNQCSESAAAGEHWSHRLNKRWTHLKPNYGSNFYEGSSQYELS